MQFTPPPEYGNPKVLVCFWVPISNIQHYTTHNHGFFLSAVLLKCMGRLAYSSNNVEVLLPLSLLGHSKNMYVKKSGLGR